MLSVFNIISCHKCILNSRNLSFTFVPASDLKSIFLIYNEIAFSEHVTV